MIAAISGGPIVEVCQDGQQSKWVPSWWVNTDRWGETVLQEKGHRRLDIGQVALTLADTIGGELTATILWVASGAVTSYLRGLRGMRVEDGLGGYCDLVLDERGQIRPEAGERSILAHWGWERVTLIRVEEGRVVAREELAGAPAWRDVAARLVRRAYRDHTIRWDLLEGAWRAQVDDLPFTIRAVDLAPLPELLEQAGVTHLSGLGQTVFQVAAGKALPWVSEARGLHRYGQFLEQQRKA